MSAEDDTFEIDIYGDEEPASEPAKESGQNDQEVSEKQSALASEAQNTKKSPVNAPSAPHGIKRKAPDEDEEEQRQKTHNSDTTNGQYIDNRPVEPGAMPALKLAELHWWTTEEDLRGFCARAGAEEELQDVSFGEHKINGKSKGEAYLEFSSPQAATAVKREIETASQAKESSGVRKTPYTVFFAPTGNPFKTGAGVGGKKDFTQGNRGGAYNSPGGNRGGFGASRGGFNRGGGGFNNPMMQNRQTQQGGWGMGQMNGGYGGFNNPMMMGGMNMGYGNMARGGMMNNMGGMMGGRGGYGNMGIGGMNMGMMGPRGGGMMGQRGGWSGGGGYQQGYGGGGGFGGGAGAGGMQGQQPKRAKTDG